MSIEVRPEVDAFTAHEFPIPCQSLWHEDWGSNGDAEWIVWQVVCCEKRNLVGFICDDCVQAILTYPGASRCRDCGTRHDPARLSIIRIEPLRGSR